MGKILITGANGQLGQDIVLEMDNRNLEYLATDKDDMNIVDKKSIEDIFKNNEIKSVIHCAAYTAVDLAEENVDICRRINAEGTRNLAEICREYNIPLMYISTDYVFDGLGEKPWEPEDHREPLNIYGQTKYEGELYVETLVEKYFIVRISWVFGDNGKNFVDTMINLGSKNKTLKVVSDQIGSPTYTKDLSVLLIDMINSEKYGKYHATNEGYCSWFDFAVEIFKQKKMDVEVIPVDSSAFPVKAKRPQNSRMNKSKLLLNGFNELPHWKNALERYLNEERG